MRILLAGRFAGVPDQGGATWAVLQYALGFERLGHEVLLIEPAPASAAAVRCFDTAVHRYGFTGEAALLHGDRRTTGLPWTEVAAWAGCADVLINLGGVLTDPELMESVALRVYVDLDPAFTQLWSSAQHVEMGFGSHDRFVTYGQAIGTSGCTIPTLGLRWLPTVPPVVLDQWPSISTAPTRGVTTVANWRSYGSITAHGVLHGQKAHSFRELADLPSLVPAVAIEPALAIHAGDDADRALLAASGWRVLDPQTVAADPCRYRAFIQASTAELGVAKTGYVVSGSAWFSDRSACYLASGRPVIAQDTGWPAFLPAGDGLLSFTDLPTAAASVDDVLGHADLHRKAARSVAEAHLDARVVLGRLLDSVGSRPVEEPV